MHKWIFIIWTNSIWIHLNESDQDLNATNWLVMRPINCHVVNNQVKHKRNSSLNSLWAWSRKCAWKVSIILVVIRCTFFPRLERPNIGDICTVYVAQLDSCVSLWACNVPDRNLLLWVVGRYCSDATRGPGSRGPPPRPSSSVISAVVDRKESIYLTENRNRKRKTFPLINKPRRLKHWTKVAGTKKDCLCVCLGPLVNVQLSSAAYWALCETVMECNACNGMFTQTPKAPVQY